MKKDSVDLKYGRCPSCGENWDGGNIIDKWREMESYDKYSDKELKEMLKSYSPPYKFSKIIGVEYPYDHPDHYDGVSEWMCPACKTRWGRWSGMELKKGKSEPRWGIPNGSKSL